MIQNSIVLKRLKGVLNRAPSGLVALGKNWLFIGPERSRRSAAAIPSLLATAKLNDLEPVAWLKDTLEKLPA